MSNADQTEAVRALYESILDRWNSRDAAGMAALFAPDAHLVGFDGSEMTGPREIEATLWNIFDHHQTAPYIHKVRSVRLVRPDIAILRAVVGMVPPGQSDVNPALHAVQTLIAARGEGRWVGEVLQNTPAAHHGRPEEVVRLTDELRQVRGARRA